MVTLVLLSDCMLNTNNSTAFAYYRWPYPTHRSLPDFRCPKRALCEVGTK